jgi:hypothetical protein
MWSANSAITILSQHRVGTARVKQADPLLKVPLLTRGALVRSFTVAVPSVFAGCPGPSLDVEAERVLTTVTLADALADVYPRLAYRAGFRRLSRSTTLAARASISPAS